MVAIYGMDSPYSQPEMVGYDAFGRPVYNRNARQKTLGAAGGIGDLDFGQSMTSTETMGGGGTGALGAVRSVAGLGRDIYDMADSGFGMNSAFGPGTAAGGMLNPTAFGAFGEAPAGFSGPTFNSAWGAADAIDMGVGGLASGISGAGPSTLAAASSTATGPGGLLAGGGATSLAPSTSSGMAAGMGPLGYGAAGVGAMMALIALGGGFDPDTARMGLNTRVPIGAGGLGSANWNQADTAIGNAPGAWSSRAAELYDALNQRIASGNVDPSWLNPDANVFIEYGADADMGFENPQAAIIFDSGLRSDPWYGADGMAGGNEPVGRVTWMPQPTGRGGAGSFDALMQMIRTAPLPMFSPAGQYQLPAELVPTLYGMSAQEIYEREMSALQDLQKA
jgi:hypothetical protein